MHHENNHWGDCSGESSDSHTRGMVVGPCHDLSFDVVPGPGLCTNIQPSDF